MAGASVIGIQHSRGALRSIVDPSRQRSANTTVVRNRGQSSTVLKAAYPLVGNNVAVNIGEENSENASPTNVAKKKGKWIDVFTHLGIVYIRKTAKNEEIYEHRRAQHYCWSTLQRGGADVLLRFIVYSVYLIIVLIAQTENNWRFEVSADVHYMFWSQTCPGEADVCTYFPKHYRHQHKTDLLLFVGVIGWIYAGLSLDIEIFEILYRKNVEFYRRWVRIAFTATLLIIGQILNGQTDVVNLMLTFTLMLTFFVQIENFKQKSFINVNTSGCTQNTERVFIACVILFIWAYSLVPTIITWADDSSKTPELVWVVNFLLFFLLWATEIVMLWAGKCNNKYAIAIAHLLEKNKIHNNHNVSTEQLTVFKKNIESMTPATVPDIVNDKSRTCCRSRQSHDSPPLSKLVSFQIVCQIIQDTIFVSYLTAVLMYSI